MFNILNFFKNKKGFTFVELMISFFIISVGLLAVFSFMRYPISQTTSSNLRLTSAYLGQEGVEIVRNIRDGNWLEGVAWNDQLTNVNSQVDYDDPELTAVINGGQLYIDTNGYYSHNGGTLTKFKRKITITSVGVSPDDYIEVSVLIEWEEKGETKSVTVEENLYNWWPY